MQLSRSCAALLFAARPCAAQGVEADAKAAAEAAEADEAAEHGDGDGDPNPLAFDPDLAIWTFVVFVLLFGFLSYFAWPQIAAALDERERKIADNIAAAAAKLEEAKRLLAEHEAKLAAAAGEVRALLEEARRDAEHTEEQIEAEGHKAAKDELDRAVARDRAGQGRGDPGARRHAVPTWRSTWPRKVIRDSRSRPSSRSKSSATRSSKLAAATPSKN